MIFSPVCGFSSDQMCPTPGILHGGSLSPAVAALWDESWRWFNRFIAEHQMVAFWNVRLEPRRVCKKQNPSGRKEEQTWRFERQRQPLLSIKHTFYLTFIWIHRIRTNIQTHKNMKGMKQIKPEGAAYPGENAALNAKSLNDWLKDL